MAVHAAIDASHSAQLSGFDESGRYLFTAIAVAVVIGKAALFPLCFKV
ncbi:MULTISPECIES: hypothetical protein [Methylomonas]|nr:MULTISPECIES: hypothetical protein [Methylomonas]